MYKVYAEHTRRLSRHMMVDAHGLPSTLPIIALARSASVSCSPSPRLAPARASPPPHRSLVSTQAAHPAPAQVARSAPEAPPPSVLVGPVILVVGVVPVERLPPLELPTRGRETHHDRCTTVTRPYTTVHDHHCRGSSGCRGCGGHVGESI